MKKKMDEFHKKTDGELAKLLLDKREELRVFRFGLSGSKVRNVKEGKEIRKDIARIKTLLKERSLQ